VDHRDPRLLRRRPRAADAAEGCARTVRLADRSIAGDVLAGAGFVDVDFEPWTNVGHGRDATTRSSS